MDDKRRVLVSVAIVGVVLLAVLSSFLPSILSKPPEVVVADPNATPSIPSEVVDTPDPSGVVVSIGPQTVQSIVAELERYESYSRVIEAAYFDDAGQPLGTASIHVWTEAGWMRSSAELSAGTVENAILGDGTLWLWYGEDGPLYTGPAERLSGDLIQHIPTYEDVLALDKDDITAADYVDREGVPCVYVEAKTGLPGYVERYWISEAGGLLMAAETVKDGAVVYSMTSGEVVSPMEQSSGAFTLPDGTALYTPDQA